MKKFIVYLIIALASYIGGCIIVGSINIWLLVGMLLMSIGTNLSSRLDKVIATYKEALKNKP